MKANIVVKGHKKEYPDLTIEEINKMIDLMDAGKTEAEALELIHNG